MYLFLAVVFAAFFAPAPQASALEATAVRFGQHGAATRIVMELSAEADFRVGLALDPPGITVDLPALSGHPGIGRSQLPALIRDVRLEPLGGTSSRLTFILSGPATIRSAFLMPARGDKPARLVIDAAPATAAAMAGQKDKTFGTLTGAATTARDESRALPFAGAGGAKLQPLSKPEIAAPVPPAAPETLPLIVIDPGHGGADPGASGSGVREKDVTLAVARMARAALESTGRYRVQLTRDRDVFIRLPERIAIARRAGADIFVSIHADSVATGGAGITGASFYTLSDRASDEQTALLAARENKADLLPGVDLPDEDHDVANILIDLTTRETAQQSKRFAGTLVRAFGKNDLPLLPGPHRHAGFMVLKAPDIPSVLVELGFLSNPEEVKKLADPAYRARLGQAIADGIDLWVKSRPAR